MRTILAYAVSLSWALFSVACGNTEGPGLGPDIDGSQPPGIDGGMSEPVGELELYTSGSRIKMRMGRTTGGAKIFLGWHDTRFQTDCAFRRDKEGALRCMPTSASTGLEAHFADAACTKEAAIINTCPYEETGEYPKWVIVEQVAVECGIKRPVTYRQTTGGG
ncbi:MAG: hypothetical protein JRH20_29430 [Deltaproteobacteria bacterium]|nr:hypothetical protein [Deltaproteobacteria bacterium]